MAESIEDLAEVTIRDEIASVLEPGALQGFTVRASRDPDDRDLLRLSLRYGEAREAGTTLALRNPAVREHLEGAIRQAVRSVLEDLGTSY
jgi:hypothetical protein